MCVIVKKFKKETEIIPSAIALVSVIEFFMIAFQIYLSSVFKEEKYILISLFSFVVYIMLNIYVFCYVKKNVLAKDAVKLEKLGQKKMKAIEDEIKKKWKREQQYQARRNRTKNEDAKDTWKNLGGELIKGGLAGLGGLGGAASKKSLASG